jgi:hypothetical protein
VTPEELASTMEGHAASCDRHATYQRNRERNSIGIERLQHHDFAVANEASAETLRQWAQRLREELT